MTKWIIAACLLVASPAYAIKVANCDKVPHTVQVHFSGSQESVTLQPNERQFVGGVPTGLSLNGQEVPVWHFDDEYCVWSGKLSRQRDGAHRRK